MNTTPVTFYQERIGLHQEEIQRLNQVLSRLALIRLLAFALGAAGVWLVWSYGTFAVVGVFLLFLAVFLSLVKWNQTQKEKRAFAMACMKACEEEIRREAMDLTGLYDGIEFADPGHPYALDMDLFGKHSLFQWICRAGTQPGRDCLAAWLKEPAPAGELFDRQQAIRELSQQPEWRESFQARGMQYEQAGDSPENLLDWVKTPSKLRQNKFLWAICLLLIPFTLGATVLYFMEIIAWYYPLIGTFLNGLVLRQAKDVTKAGFEASEGKAKLLKSYAALVDRIEAGEFESKWLLETRNHLRSSGKSGSQEIRELAHIFEMLEIRLNGLAYVIVNTFFFWDIYWNIRLESWRERNREQIGGWFEVIGEFEAAASLAGIGFLRPDWAFPKLSEAPLLLKVEDAGHPLLPPSGRVDNPIQVDGPGKIMLITGSNMSGKSTYQRTVGLNVVLALAGAPVCARSMEIGRISLISTMRTVDSVSENISSFYAELKRLRQVLDLAEERDDVLFLLDEILKGTNSGDRHTGARGLIRQLHNLGASGLVSTHDLELSQLEGTMNGAVSNYSFNSELVGDKLVFDYKLTPGPCKSFNASILMRQLGIGVVEK
ncbi:MAG: hypothetical protein H6581_02515 [Bacteroidia bacterium]|nr:hypothetical protein [Bacteroidia bacterium]